MYKITKNFMAEKYKCSTVSNCYVTCKQVFNKHKTSERTFNYNDQNWFT